MITELEITGFRLLEKFQADLGQLTVVIGANATGKSTLVDALRMISQCAEFPLETVVNWHGGMFSMLSASSKADRVAWRLKLVKPREHPFWKTAPLGDDHALVYEVTIARDTYGQPSPTSESLVDFANAAMAMDKTHPSQGDRKRTGRRTKPSIGDAGMSANQSIIGSGDLRVVLEATPGQSWIFDEKRGELVPFDVAVPASAGPKNSEIIGGGPGPSVSVPAREPALLRLAQMRFVNEYPQPSWTRLLLTNMAFYPGFEVGQLSALRTKPADIKPETMLMPTGENLGTVVHEIRTRGAYRSSDQALQEFLRSAYPFVEEVRAETAYGGAGKVLVRLSERGMERPMELWDLSDGTVRFLCLAVALLNPVPPALIAIDEPETGLHPRLLPVVADMIKTASEKTQVLVTTHSPDLLNCFDLDNVAVMARDDARVIWHRPATRHTLRELLQPVTGETLGDLHRTGELEALP